MIGGVRDGRQSVGVFVWLTPVWGREVDCESLRSVHEVNVRVLLWNSSSSMSNGGDHWIRGSGISILSPGAIQKVQAIAGSNSDASCIVSTYAPTQGNFESTELQQNVSYSILPQHSISGAPTLKEHDYIGLSSDLSCSSIEHTNLTAGLAKEECVGKALPIKSLETELRLGLGPPDESEGVRESDRETSQGIVGCSVGYSGLVATLPIDPNVVNVTASNACVPQPSLKQLADNEVGTSSLKCRNDFYGSAAGVEASKAADNANDFSQVTTNCVTSLEPLQSWNGERSIEAGDVCAFGAFMLSQRGLVSVGSQIPEFKLHSQQKQASEVHDQEGCHRTKEQAWPSQSIAPQHRFVLDKPNSMDYLNKAQHPEGPRQWDASNQQGASSGKVVRGSHDHNRIPLKASSLPPDDPLASTSLKYWHSPIFPSLDAPLGAQSGLEAEKASSMGNASGFVTRYVTSVPKCTVPAKRGFLEAIGSLVESKPGHPMENRNVPLDFRGNAVCPVSCVEGEMKLATPQAWRPYPSVSHPWSTLLQQLPGSWQKGLGAGIPRGNDALSGIKDSHMKPPSDKINIMQATKPNEDAQHVTNLSDDNGASSARAPVGWPPIRSFRKNSVAVNSKPNSEERDATGSSDCPQSGQPEASTLYVKANMDGVPIGRKVNLKAYNSYESLKLALQDMFQSFFQGHNGNLNLLKEDKQLNLLQGTDYVLTHEDNDGDWMLAGDVPWDMFLCTVKRLRIMKVCDAIGLGKRVSTKLKCPDQK
eukprot:c27468_g1_i1 orf=246-2528(+)